LGMAVVERGAKHAGARNAARVDITWYHANQEAAAVEMPHVENAASVWAGAAVRGSRSNSAYQPAMANLPPFQRGNNGMFHLARALNVAPGPRPNGATLATTRVHVCR